MNLYMYVPVTDLGGRLPVTDLRGGGFQERKEMFYLTTYSTHFIYGDMASNIW